jgi:hypothetical protein
MAGICSGLLGFKQFPTSYAATRFCVSIMNFRGGGLCRRQLRLGSKCAYPFTTGRPQHVVRRLGFRCNQAQNAWFSMLAGDYRRERITHYTQWGLKGSDY